VCLYPIVKTNSDSIESELVFTIGTNMTLIEPVFLDILEFVYI